MSAQPAALNCLIQQNASLRRYNTFGIDARARWLVRLRLPAALPEILDRPEWQGAPLLVLGDGSNVLLREDFEGLVIKLDCQRVELLDSSARGHLVRAEAARNWHAFVNWTLERDIAGLENLSLIPGTVGAAPVQNIGAYGVEIDPLVDEVEAYDRQERRFVSLDRAACGFGYRDSVFKRAGQPPRWLITAVRFRLPQHAPLVLHYPGVQEELAARGATEPTARDVSEAISSIRRRKLPDPSRIGNAGSFFKNPIVPAERARELREQFPAIPMFPAAEGRNKIAAAWLIEQCGLRGHRDGDAGVSDSHALVLVNHGHATGAQLWALAQRVQQAVADKFDVLLEPEPLVV